MNTAIIALLILGALAFALLWAGAYALFGKPRSPEWKKRQRHIKNGFVIAGGILLGAVLVGFLVGGIGIAFFGIQSSRISSKPVGFLIAVASFCLIALFVGRWAKYFAGWIVCSVLNALIMASTGHLLNNPSVSVPRSVALIMAGLMVITVVASIRFRRGYKLNFVDRAALLFWVLAFAIGANTERYMLVAAALGCAGLVLAYLYHRRSRGHSHLRPATVLADSR